VAYVSGTASRIEAHRLQEAVEERPNIRRLMRTFMAVHAAETFQTIACNAVHPIASRCCRWLLNVHDRLGQDKLPLTHELVANVLGVQRSTLTEILGSLQAAGCIAQGRGAIVIIDRASLEQRTCECYWKVRELFERKLPQTYSAVQT
jgi:CRP-like cAMP-binding protein